jgi:prepilin-type N-terminal cleavage/methylation domain-containing protein
MIRQQTGRAGFTIVELLIVIVVIAVLAAIVIVAYNGVQNRANDSRRLQDLKSITKALELYKTSTGSYPNPNSTANASGWEVSTDGTSATDFLSVLRTSSTVTRIPVDPRNLGVLPNITPTRASTSFEYFYYKYTAGTNGCDSTRGDYYVLGATRMDTVASGANYPSNPGFSCSGRDWVTTGAWVTGGYTN